MPTAILDLDLMNLPTEVGNLDNYDTVFILIRFRRNPIGKLTVPVSNGRLVVAACYPEILRAVKFTLQISLQHYYLDWDERNIIDFDLPSATIAICTRDRPADLKRCLDALMQLPDDGQELLVIDNCPSDDESLKVVRLYPQVRYVREDRAGLNNARNRALLEARHDVVAFTDDDAYPDSGWLRALVRNFNHPFVVCVTGLTMPFELETPAQEAFEHYSPFGKGFSRVVYTGTTHDPLSTGRIGAGANMALRKNILQSVGPFNDALDAGTPTHSGGDHEIFARILMSGYHIVYDPHALNWHRHRRTWDELRKTLYGYGVGVYSIFTHHLITNRELSVFKLGFKWFWHDQLRKLVKSLLRRPGCVPTDLIVAELKGCIAGPWAYYRSRRKSRVASHHKV